MLEFRKSGGILINKYFNMKKSSQKNFLSLIGPYWWFLGLILLVNLGVNGLGLWIPKVISGAMDSFGGIDFDLTRVVLTFVFLSVLIFLFSLIQSFLQTYLAETVGRDLRTKLVNKIAKQQFNFINELTPEKLLTVVTSDVDNIKQALTVGLVQVFSSIVMIVGSSILLLGINWKLALMVLVVVPIIAVVFVFLFSRIKNFFKRSQAVIDRLNRIISESIVASALIRIVNSQQKELEKFNDQNGQAKEIGMSIMRLFSSLIPLVGLIANATGVLILLMGGKFILSNELTIGELVAFNNYLWMLIFPIIMLGFISNILARAMTSYQRINQVLEAEDKNDFGSLEKEITGKINFKNVSLKFGQKEVLKNISFEVHPGSKTAILGPTAAGKTQIFYLLSGLLNPDGGEILIDNVPIKKYSQKCLSGQLGLVFQDSSIFNTTLKENINFKNVKDNKGLEKAIDTAALGEFIESLPDGLETKITERGSNLSGGQKQRLTLARALAINPKILLLDDFTARVDKSTEKEIFTKLKKNYEGITQVLITQQISSVLDFDQIILIMEGEVLARGTHKELLKNCSEYQQLFSSQRSTQ